MCHDGEHILLEHTGLVETLVSQSIILQQYKLIEIIINQNVLKRSQLFRLLESGVY
jgi:hypothetical protein